MTRCVEPVRKDINRSLWPGARVCAETASQHTNHGHSPRIAPASPPVHESAGRVPWAGREHSVDTGHIRVLIVDDDPLIRYELAALLHEESIDVAGQAADGAAGVSLAVETRPNVVLMDLRMPRMGGLEATRRIREALPTTQVVLLSAYDDPGLRLEAAQLGACAYLVKGGPAGEVIDAIHHAWNICRGHGEGGQQR